MNFFWCIKHNIINHSDFQSREIVLPLTRKILMISLNPRRGRDTGHSIRTDVSQGFPEPESRISRILNSWIHYQLSASTMNAFQFSFPLPVKLKRLTIVLRNHINFKCINVIWRIESKPDLFRGRHHPRSCDRRLSLHRDRPFAAAAFPASPSSRKLMKSFRIKNQK
jgi:hypothetical protein